MYVHSKEESRWVSKFIAEKGVWHPGPSYWLKDLLAMYPGQAFQKPVVVDVGANIGWFTLLSAANGAKVFAFEPMNYNFELLNASMHLNPLFDIWVMQTALSDEESSEYICMRPQSGGNTSENKDNGQLWRTSGQSDCAERTQLTTLDLALSGPESMRHGVYFIKIDIEGYEVKAISGAKELFHSATPPCFVMMEKGEQQHGDSLATILDDFRSLGYQIWHFANSLGSPPVAVTSNLKGLPGSELLPKLSNELAFVYPLQPERCPKL